MKRTLRGLLLTLFITGMITSIALAATLTNDDFNLTVKENGSYQISLLADINILNDTLGTALNVTNYNMEVPVADYMYRYVSFYTDNNNQITCITGENIRTSRGINASSTVEQVKTAYGEPDYIEPISNNHYMMVYCEANGERKIMFKISNFLDQRGLVYNIQTDVFSSILDVKY
jgi:hypothetical protein